MRQGATLLIVASALLFAMPCGAVDQSLQARTDSWREDLRFFVTQLREHHRNAFHLVTQEQFAGAVTALDTQIPQLQDYEVVVALESLAAMVGDGHTFVATSGSQHRFPLKLYWFGDELRVVAASSSYARALGMRVIRMDNGGGNYAHGRDYLLYGIQARRSLNRRGALYVITGRGTFSAGMTNAVDFRRETEALLVGEPPGARPNGYQENFWFTLPHSQLRVSVATNYYRFSDTDSPVVEPDQRIDPSWTDYEAGRDAATEWILQRKECL